MMQPLRNGPWKWSCSLSLVEVHDEFVFLQVAVINVIKTVPERESKDRALTAPLGGAQSEIPKAEPVRIMWQPNANLKWNGEQR